MADDVSSQARFVGWLALALMAFAIISALTVLYAATAVAPTL